MFKRKVLIGFVMVLALLALQVGAAYAAPASQSTTITGTVQSITQSTDSSGNTVFDVTITDSGGNTTTVTLSAADAVTLGLVTQNPDGTYTIKNTAVGSTITVPGTGGTTNPCSETENNFVAKALSMFFCSGSSTVLDNTVDGLHTEGFGYGEIAQACFMAEVLNSTCGDILNAKQSHDFSTLGLPTDVTVKNWGQLRKYAFSQEVKSLTNLGAIMSGRAQPPAVSSTPVPTAMSPMSPFMPGNGHGNGNGQGNGHGNGGGNGNGHGNGGGNGNGHQP